MELLKAKPTGEEGGEKKKEEKGEDSLSTLGEYLYIIHLGLYLHQVESSCQRTFFSTSN